MQFHTGPGKLTLAAQRSNQVANRHPNDREKCATICEYMEPVQASDRILLNQRDWVCFFCDKALPALVKAVKEASAKLHYRTYHPRRKIEAARLTALRWKLAKEDPSKVIIYRKCQKRLGEALRRRAAECPVVPKANRHHAVPAKVNWETWHGERVMLLSPARNAGEEGKAPAESEKDDMKTRSLQVQSPDVPAGRETKEEGRQRQR